jgi:hypothetical protein
VIRQDEAGRRRAHEKRVLDHLERTTATAQGFGDKPTPPRINGRRVFHGRPQLTSVETKVIEQVRQQGLKVIFEGGEPQFWCGSRRVRRDTAERLITRGYLLADDPPLICLPGIWAQSYRAYQP